MFSELQSAHLLLTNVFSFSRAGKIWRTLVCRKYSSEKYICTFTDSTKDSRLAEINGSLSDD